MKSLKKVFAIVFIGIFAVGMLTACGGGNQSVEGNSAGPIPAGSGSSAALIPAGSGSSSALVPEELEELEKNKEATDTANVRSASADVMALYLEDNKPHSVTVPAEQEQAGWQDENQGKILWQIDGEEKIYYFAAHTKDDGPYTVSVSETADGVTVEIE